MAKMRTWKHTEYLPKYIKNKARKVNKVLNAWDNAGLTSNDLEMVKDMLSDFYENIGLNVKDSERASERIRLSKSEKEEYNNLLNFILWNDEVDLQRRTLKNQQIRAKWNEINKNTYEKVKAQFDYIKDEQDFIKFTDRINKYKKDRLLTAILSSNQIASLYSAGITGAYFSEPNINKMIVDEYEKTGLTGGDLQESIINIIEREEKKIKMKGVKNAGVAKPKRHRRRYF